MNPIPIGAAIRELAERDPNRPAITHGSQTITRLELESKTNRLARAYQTMGVEQDQLVAIALPNGIPFYEAAIAAWKLGATPMPISARLPERERNAVIDVAEPTLVVGASAPGRPNVPSDYQPDSSLTDDPLPDLVAASWKAPASGGSTGRPKVILSSTPGIAQPGMALLFGIPDDGVQLVPGPLYHNAPFMFSSIGLFAGNHIVVMTRFDAPETLELIARHRVQWLWLVPTMMSRIMKLDPAERDSKDVSSIERMWHGAAACPAWVKQAWIEWLGPERVWELYGGTEAQLVTIISGSEWLEHRSSVGRPLVGEMKILGGDGGVLPPGEVGEIYMRSESKTYEYLGATPKQFEGWESIGDMGWVDSDGYLYIADRRTDMIVTGGANVYPAEVEAALDEHPAVRTSAVIGLPDEDMGNVVHAIVEMDGEVSDSELRTFLAERLASYKIPRSFERTREVLRDDAGKVRRFELRAARTKV